MNGIKMSECNFYVNEEKRTVVCVIPGTKQMLEDFFYEHFNFSDINMIDGIEFSRKTEEQLWMPKYFTGKAVCSETDEWNEELGRLIAFNRARTKCYKSFFKRANTMVQAIDRRLGDMIDTFNDFGMKIDAKQTVLEAKIEEMTQKE